MLGRSPVGYLREIRRNVVGGGGVTQIDAADPSWASATITGIRYAVIYKSGGGNPLLWLIDFGADQMVTNGTFSVVLPSLGIETFSRP